jgi:hypothetical protein
MFGYVTPFKMELKIKDYEKFKGYYCGLCIAIKNKYGNIPRLALNYDMTFLAILLDSLEDKKSNFYKASCIVHHIKKKIILKTTPALEYAAFCNTALTYFKLIDNAVDDNSLKSRLYSRLLKPYLNKSSYELKIHIKYMENCLKELYNIELNPGEKGIDEISHYFADLTGYIMSSYKNDENKETLYKLGYNLGKWIYLIDAYDDLEKDINKNKFNPINSVFNKEKENYELFSNKIKNRIDYILVRSAQQCLQYFEQLPLKKNQDILFNILQYGLMGKMDTVFKRSELINEEPV